MFPAMVANEPIHETNLGYGGHFDREGEGLKVAVGADLTRFADTVLSRHASARMREEVIFREATDFEEG